MSCLSGRWEATAGIGMGDPVVAHMRSPDCVDPTAAGSRCGQATIRKHNLGICSILHARKSDDRARGSVSMHQGPGSG